MGVIVGMLVEISLRLNGGTNFNLKVLIKRNSSGGKQIVW